MVLPAVIWLIWRVKLTPFRILLISCLGGVHLFFLLAQTKMVCYTMVLLPFYCVAVGNVLVDLSERIPRASLSKGLLVLATMALCYFSLDMQRIMSRHSLRESPLVDVRWRKQNIKVMDDLPQLAHFLSRYQKPILFNMPRNHNYRFMFAYGIDAWPKAPSPEAVQRLREKGYMVLVLQDGADPGSFPAGSTLVPDSVFAITKDVRM